MGNTKTYSGFTSATANNLMLDAGAFFKNFDIATDTFDTAVTNGKLIGATQGGGSFAAIPSIRQIPVDGVKGNIEGLNVIDSWAVTLTANVLEISADTIELALGTTTSSSQENNDFYKEIKANNYILDADYIDNVTFIGKISGVNKPVVIQVFNAMNTNGLTLTTTDNAEGVIEMVFTGHYSASALDNPPFAIEFPIPEGAITGIIKEGVALVSGATVTVTIEGEEFTDTTGADGVYLIEGLPAIAVTVSAEKGTAVGTDTGTVVAGATTDFGDLVIESP